MAVRLTQAHLDLVRLVEQHGSATSEYLLAARPGWGTRRRLDQLVAGGMLTRDGDGRSRTYRPVGEIATSDSAACSNRGREAPRG